MSFPTTFNLVEPPDSGNLHAHSACLASSTLLEAERCIICCYPGQRLLDVPSTEAPQQSRHQIPAPTPTSMCERPFLGKIRTPAVRKCQVAQCRSAACIPATGNAVRSKRTHLPGLFKFLILSEQLFCTAEFAWVLQLTFQSLSCQACPCQMPHRPAREVHTPTCNGVLTH
jgi:hypothetical protein